MTWFRTAPAGVVVFLAYALLILAAIGISLPAVIATAVDTPIAWQGLLAMGLLAYTIFTITLTIQRKEAARGLALGLSSLTLPAIPLLLLSGLVPAAIVVTAVAIALFGGLTRPGVRAYLSEA
jgi:hypothetical protein